MSNYLLASFLASENWQLPCSFRFDGPAWALLNRLIHLWRPPLFPWLESRHAGVLLHPTSLPGDLGIGKLGREARRLIDFLEASGMRYWQLCSMGPTGYGDSPYQCFSAFAGNPYLIDLNPLVGFGLLKESELKPLQRLPHDHVDYGELYQRFWPILDLACERFSGKLRDSTATVLMSNFANKKMTGLPPMQPLLPVKHTTRASRGVSGRRKSVPMLIS